MYLVPADPHPSHPPPPTAGERSLFMGYPPIHPLPPFHPLANMLCIKHCTSHWWIQGGAPGTRVPPGGPNSFIFMQFSAKIINKHTHFGSWRPPRGKS